MGTSYLLCIIIICIIGLAVYVSLKGKDKKSSAYSSLKEKESKLMISDDFYSTRKKDSSMHGKNDRKTNSLTNDKHSKKTIYSYTMDESLWICPNCEVENSSYRTVCCSCSHTR